MELLTGIKLKHEASRPATDADIAKAEEMVEWFNKTNGSFQGAYSNAFAVSHCQVDQDDPIAFFIVSTDFIESMQEDKPDEKLTDESYWFPAQAIFNPKVTKALPAFIVEDEDSRGRKKKHAASNVHYPKDACMSYPYRKPKSFARFLHIDVEYQVAVDGKLETRTESIKGLKAHMFQHEIDHHNGIDIHFGDGERKQIPIEERLVGVEDHLPE